MFIAKNTYTEFEKNREEILESLSDYFKNIYFMKCLNKSLGPTFPGNTSDRNIQLLNLFYLNAFNSLLTTKGDKTDISVIQKALLNLITLLSGEYSASSGVSTKIMFIQGMFKEHFNLNFQGIPENMLTYIHDNIDTHNIGLKEWTND